MIENVRERFFRMLKASLLSLKISTHISDDFSPSSELDVLRNFILLISPKRKQVIMSSFQYLIFVDFEATCWGGYRTRQQDMEIIGTTLFRFLKC